MLVDTRSFAPMSLGLLTPHNPYDRRKFSGTPFFATRALARHPRVRLKILGGHAPQRLRDKVLRRRAPNLTPETLLDVSGLEAVVGLVASPLLETLHKNHPDLPYLHITDATPNFLRDAYGWSVPGEADATETRVVGGALSTIYSSKAMAERAGADLGLEAPATDVAPFGVNFENLPQTCPLPPDGGRIELLFVGLDWVRKGGDIAVATLDHLRASGREAHLTIVGRCPDHHRAHPAITYAGFLNKNRARDAARLAQLYTKAHVLLLPSRADCTPMVIGEAMAHGTPVLASDTGGVAAMLGNTGQVMPALAPPEDWAKALIVQTGPGYAARAQASFVRAHHVLSWDRWADAVVEVLQTRLPQRASTTVEVGSRSAA